MYVPENHHITQEPFIEREDEGHVFNRLSAIDANWRNAQARLKGGSMARH